jgi:hypothetical protein
MAAKSWDLDGADAYKQVPLSDRAYDMDAFFVVYSTVSKGQEIFQHWHRVLPFGSVASVTAFLRVAQACPGPLENSFETTQFYVVFILG